MRTDANMQIDEEILPPDYISGLVDGEGCFALNFRRDKRHERKGKPEYFYWVIKFVIVLRNDDKDLLEKVRNTFDCGHITVSKNMARYCVDRIGDLRENIVPFFVRHPLYGKKRRDFLLWTEALDILYQNMQLPIRKGKQGFAKKQWELSDIQRLLGIKQEMERYKAKGPAWKWLSAFNGGNCEIGRSYQPVPRTSGD